MKKSLLALAALAMAACFLLVGCGSPIVGTVVDKDYSSGYYYTTTQMMCNAQNVCTPLILTHYMPDSYWLDVDTGEEDTRRAYVNVEYWDQTEIGDHFDNTPEDER